MADRVSHPKMLREVGPLSLPHLPWLGLRALCINSLDLHMTCKPSGGQLKIIRRDSLVATSAH